MTIRFFILQAHYRGTLDFSNEALQAAEKGYERLMKAVETLPQAETFRRLHRRRVGRSERALRGGDGRRPEFADRDFRPVRLRCASINQIYDGHRTISEADLKELARVVRLFVFDMSGAEVTIWRATTRRCSPRSSIWCSISASRPKTRAHGLGNVRPNPRRARLGRHPGQGSQGRVRLGNRIVFGPTDKALAAGSVQGLFYRGIVGLASGGFSGFGRSGGRNVALLAAVVAAQPAARHFHDQ